MRALLLLLFALIPLAGQPSNNLSPGQIRAIEQLVTRTMKQHQMPGVSVAVATGGELAWSRGFGLADVENKVRATENTVYRIASISKPITATAILQLAEQGRIDLDAAIRKYVPSFPEKPWPITARQLLGHLGGIRHYRNTEEINSTRRYQDLLAPLAIFANDPLVAEPGTEYSYSTYGYALLGAALETASGSAYMDYIAKRIFAPAGMEHTQADDVYAIIPNRARGYRLREGTLENCDLADTSNKIPSGGMSSTAADIARFAVAVRNGALLRTETVAEMLTPLKLSSGEATDYGLGWNVGQSGRIRWVGHSGGQQGVATMFVMAPEPGAVAVVMSNLEQSPVGELALAILDIIIE